MTLVFQHVSSFFTYKFPQVCLKGVLSFNLQSRLGENVVTSKELQWLQSLLTAHPHDDIQDLTVL